MISIMRRRLVQFNQAPMTLLLNHLWSMGSMMKVSRISNLLKPLMHGEMLAKEKLIQKLQGSKSRAQPKKSLGARILSNSWRISNKAVQARLQKRLITLQALSRKEQPALRKRSHQLKSHAGIATNYTCQTSWLTLWKKARNATAQIFVKRNTTFKIVSPVWTKNAASLSSNLMGFACTENGSAQMVALKKTLKRRES